MAVRTWTLALGLLALMVAAPAAGASLFSSSFTVAEPRSGDSGLYTPGAIAVDDEPQETRGMEFAFELGDWTAREDAYGVERDVVPFRSYFVSEGQAVELPVTTWVHARASPPIAQEVHLASLGMGGSQGGSWGGDLVLDRTRYANQENEPWGPECMFLTGLQGETLQEGASLPLQDVCGQDLTGLAEEHDADVDLSVAEVEPLEEGGQAARLLLTVDADQGRMELDLWYKDQIPYPVELSMKAWVDNRTWRDEDPSTETNHSTQGWRGLELFDPFTAWFDQAEEQSGQGEELVFEARIELERFHRGSGAIVPPGNAPDWPQRHQGLTYDSQTRWGPPDGGESFPYPHQEAVQEVTEDPTLVEFQTWLEEHPEARALAASFTESVTESERTYAWTFHVFADDDEAWRVSSERTAEARAPGQGLLEAPVPITENEADAYAVDPDRIDLDAVPDELPTIGSLVSLWERLDPDTAQQEDANHLAWVQQPLPNSGVQLPGLAVGWTDPGEGDPGPQSWFTFEENRSTVQLNGSSWAVDTRERTVVNMEGAWLGQGAGTQAPGWHGRGFQGASAQPAAMDAPVVMGIATAGTVTLLVLLLVKLGVGIPFYSRISRDELLENKTRRMVYEAIGDDRGLGLREVAKQADCSVSTARYHLRRLDDEDMVASAAYNGTRRWFPAGDFDQEEMRKEAVLEIGDTREVYEAIQATPGASLSDIADAVGSSPPAVHKIVDRLIEAGLVEKERDGRSVALHVLTGREARASSRSS